MMKSSLKNRVMRVESLEDRVLLAVTAGSESAALYAPAEPGSTQANVIIETGTAEAIRAALQNVADGGTVTFSQNLSSVTIDVGSVIHISKNVTIIGNGVTLTNSNSAQGGVFEIDDAYSCTDVTIESTNFSDSCAKGYSFDMRCGGAIRCVNYAYDEAGLFVNITLEGCRFARNVAGVNGGAVYFHGVNTTMHSNFVNNDALNGGAIYLDHCDAQFLDNGCAGNAAREGEGGAVVLSECGTVVFRHGLMEGNASVNSLAVTPESFEYAARGGAVVIKFCENVSFAGMAFNGNYAAAASYNCDRARGGAVYIFDSNVTFESITFFDNDVAKANSCEGGAVYISGNGGAYNHNTYGQEIYKPTSVVSFNLCSFTNNTIGLEDDTRTTSEYAYRGGVISNYGDLTLIDCAFTNNRIYGNANTTMMQGSAIYTDCSRHYYNAAGLDGGYAKTTLKYCTIAGNGASSRGEGIYDAATGEEASAVRDSGNADYFATVLLGNYHNNVESGEWVTFDLYSTGNPDNGAPLSKLVSSAYSSKTSKSVAGFDVSADTYDMGTDPRGYTRHDFFTNYIAGIYTLSRVSPAIDAVDMSLYDDVNEHDVRGYEYARLVNGRADMGAYEYQDIRPTLQLTVKGWTGQYDMKSHSVTVSGTQSKDFVYYSTDGINYSKTKPYFVLPGNYTVYVKAQREGYNDFLGQVEINIQGSSEPLAAPTIITGTGLNYVSCGANRQQIAWNAVANASSYELAYSTDGGSNWTTLQAAGTDKLVTRLSYGATVQYKVRALGTGLYSNSAWSNTVSFTVCPMDVDGDGLIGPGDHSIVSSCWFMLEGDEGWIPGADIDGDGAVGPGDHAFLSPNWFCLVGEDELVYPQPLAADLAESVFESVFDKPFDVWA